MKESHCSKCCPDFKSLPVIGDGKPVLAPGPLAAGAWAAITFAVLLVVALWFGAFWGIASLF